MEKVYCGILQRNDPLYAYLLNEIQPMLQGFSRHTDYQVFKMKGSKDVYLYEDASSGDRIVGKFYLSQGNNGNGKEALWVQQEFQNLCLLRGIGLAEYPHYVIRPLACNPLINNILIVEYCEGETLSAIINEAIFRRGDNRLKNKLTALAYFLATMHNITAIGSQVDIDPESAYLEEVLAILQRDNQISCEAASLLYHLFREWILGERLREDRQVLIHGDATPGNFLFGEGLSVTAIDLERMRYADRAYDLGRIAAELQHFFLIATGNKYEAEPYIGHFLKSYSSHFPDRERAFQSITGRVPFYMGTTLLRIARNDWLDWDYRRLLVNEAMLTFHSIIPEKS